MSVYAISAKNTSQQSPTLAKGTIRISTTVSVYWVIGENPQITPGKSAILPAGATRELRLPVKCSKLAVQAVKDPGVVTIVEVLGGASSSCSS